MLHNWLIECSQPYLRRILDQQFLAPDSELCHRCQSHATVYVCRECPHQVSLCASCICSQHAAIPTHRLRRWTGDHFEPSEFKDLGYVFHLGHGGLPCDLGVERDFILGDLNGLHSIRIKVCKHRGSGGTARQLLSAKIYPCSDKSPATGFTFAVLRHFHLMSTEAKLSTQRCYNVLVCQTNNVFPDTVPDRYREFGRVTRQWQHLSDLKHAGSHTTMPGAAARCDLSISFPACPREGVNYTAEDIQADTK